MVMSCLTCFEKTNKYAALCRDCALECHKDHILEDLHYKRNLRCDCGNGNFEPDFHCKIFPKKAYENIENTYDQNFEKKYCICGKGYEDEDCGMVQCLICQNWYHFNCILKKEAVAPEETDKINQCIIVPHSVKDRICSCKQCVSLLSEEKLMFIIDSETYLDYLDEQFDYDTLNELYNSYVQSKMSDGDKMALGVFEDVVKKFANYANGIDRVITVEDVRIFFETLVQKRFEK
ncbi:MAG: hypothetical protein MHPSP_000642 [Paramarteilia canceri]